ncbi:hypothetical protein [Oxynema aestuarii]|uniref:Uncharacterized protein n=1 Tax=Oxynema aestuarii AP17 TaxID=2064643 RepID=A0A6H1TZ71_9CYAN|nr:hypothetical protein [Oxynema aestuarii]QIZ71884.1 hypothetical protein HCG48_15920 [Oxynema aestuarii AP17]RMH72289.1 MAG: hypothetical protein D6680_19565 [Cyanobacteria bacterium J007]
MASGERLVRAASSPALATIARAIPQTTRDRTFLWAFSWFSPTLNRMGSGSGARTSPISPPAPRDRGGLEH